MVGIELVYGAPFCGDRQYALVGADTSFLVLREPADRWAGTFTIELITDDITKEGTHQVELQVAHSIRDFSHHSTISVPFEVTILVNLEAAENQVPDF